MAKIYCIDGSIKTVKPANKVFTEKELQDMIGKNFMATTPKHIKSHIFIYSEVEDDWFNIKASERAGVNLSGVVLECDKTEVDFEF